MTPALRIRDDIALTLGVARSNIQDNLKRAAAAGLSWRRQTFFSLAEAHTAIAQALRLFATLDLARGDGRYARVLKALARTAREQSLRGAHTSKPRPNRIAQSSSMGTPKRLTTSFRSGATPAASIGYC